MSYQLSCVQWISVLYENSSHMVLSHSYMVIRQDISKPFFDFLFFSFFEFELIKLEKFEPMTSWSREYI